MEVHRLLHIRVAPAGEHGIGRLQCESPGAARDRFRQRALRKLVRLADDAAGAVD